MASYTQVTPEEEVAGLTSDAKEAWEKLIRNVMRGDVIKTGKRLGEPMATIAANATLKLSQVARETLSPM